ncbi:MAG: hypothetical protein JRN51_10500 [Nitrososphaerota archaeon]|nr:hypothetical protein [Nitrososphaerota archaeon]
MKKTAVEDYLGAETATRLSSEKRPVSSFRDLYPEYGEMLRGNFCTSLEPYTKIWELVPFREVQIVHINVELKSEREFFQWYGVSTNDILSLEKNNQAVIMINLPSEAKELPDYLDPILEKGFPTSRRIVDHIDASVPVDADSNLIRFEIVRLFSEKSKVAVDTMQSDPDRIRRTTEAVVASLLAINEREELERILQLLRAGEIDGARRELEFSRLYLVGAPVYSLSGFHTISWRSISNGDTPSRSLVGKVEFFSPAGAVLAKRFHLYRPASFEDALDKRHDYEKARRALGEFDKRIRARERKAKSSEEAVELQDIESHFSELIKSYEGRKKIVDAVFVGGSIASSFVGATFLPIMALTAAASLDEVVRILCGRRPIGRSLVKIAEPRGLRSFFDIYEGTKNQAA